MLVVAGVSCGGDTTQPDQPVPTTLSLNKTAVSFSSLGQTDQLTATVLDQNGNTLAGQSISFTTSATGIATVNASGLVTAIANGSATITASSGSLQGQATVTVAQVVTQLVKVTGDAQTDTVGQTLPTAIEVELRDARSNPVTGGAGGAVANAVVNFAVTAGGGAVAQAAAPVGTNGRASTAWTLGTTAGDPQSVSATLAGGSVSASFSATAVAGAADTLAIVSGTNQTGGQGSTLPDSLVVRVVDAFGNPVAGHTITWVETSGNGTLSPAGGPTDASGRARTEWTLGPGTGMQTAEAQAGSGVNGSPAAFTATAVNLTIAAVSPDTLVEGAAATIDGSGFDPTPANNMVMIGGTAAVVTAASVSQLTVTVPTFDCRPARDVNVQVTVGGANSNSVSRRLHPPAFLSLAAGEQTIVQSPANFCLQLRPSTSGGDVYMVGVGAAAETPTSTMAFTISAETGGAPTAPPALVTDGAARPSAAGGRVGAASTAIPDGAAQLVAMQRRSEGTLRDWERRTLSQLRPPASNVGRTRAAIAQVPPNLGDTIQYRVLTNASDPCNSFAQITTVVRAVGTAGVWVTDINNPTTDSLTLAEIQAYRDTFDLHIYARDTLYFGTPSDIDNNQRVVIVLTIEVNKIPQGFAGFVFSGDLFSRSQCASSDTGEIFYAHVPDPGNVAGTGARSKSNILFQMPSLIAHEFTHNIQQSRRLIVHGSNTGLTSWEAEGQATLAEEVVGHSVLGNAQGQNYTSVTARQGQGARWYGATFDQVGLYFGRQSGGGKAANAPELCTLFGSTSLSTPCNAFHFYGASWAFQRFVSDRFGAGYTGGEAQLHRDVISLNPTLQGRANWEALLGVDFDSLFSQWGGMLYADDRILTAAPQLQMTSWNLFEIMNSYGSTDFQLIPVDRAFGAFSDSRSVRGGSNAYTRITASVGPRPALAIKVRDGSGAVLGTGMAPQVWIVRQQ